MNDNQIIALYLARDEDAVGKTAEKYGGYCFAIANNILANEQDAEECVNDAYLRVWNTIPPARPNNFKTFIAKIIRNLSIDRYRTRTRDKRGGGEIVAALDEIEDTVADASEVDCEEAEREFVRLLNGFLRSLPARDCNIFIRRYFYMENAATIARMYGLKEGNVLVILSRTRRKLREALMKEGKII